MIFGGNNVAVLFLRACDSLIQFNFISIALSQCALMQSSFTEDMQVQENYAKIF